MIPGVTQVKGMADDSWLYHAEDVFLGPLKHMMEDIHAYGSKFFLQLGASFGRVMGAPPDMEAEEMHRILVAPSDGIPNVWNPSVKHRGLTREEIAEYVDAYAKSALLCKEAGIDGVEIHAVHEGYLLDQIAIACTKPPQDEYGGTLENGCVSRPTSSKRSRRRAGPTIPSPSATAPRANARV
jgi:2-enoate reductase